MGNLVSRFVSNKTKKIIILGDEGAGKTTIFGILNTKYNKNSKRCDTPSGGFNVDVIKDIVVWDLSGKRTFIPFWKCYFNNVDGVIWVVDATSKNNKEVFETMKNFMALNELLKCNLLVFINKVDLVDEAFSAKIMKDIDLLFKNRPIKICCTSRKNTNSLIERFDWFCEKINSSKSRRFYYLPF